jgi:hypothetical protein
MAALCFFPSVYGCAPYGSWICEVGNVKTSLVVLVSFAREVLELWSLDQTNLNINQMIEFETDPNHELVCFGSLTLIPFTDLFFSCLLWVWVSATSTEITCGFV